MAVTGARGDRDLPGALVAWLMRPTLTGERRADEAGMNAARWRRSAGVFLIYLAYAVVDMARLHDGPATMAYGFVILAVFICLYLSLLPQVLFGDQERHRLTVMLGMTACVVCYLPIAGGGGLVMTIYLAMTFVLLLRPIVSLPLVAACVVVETWLPEQVGWWQADGPQWSLSGPALLSAIAMYGVRAGARNQAELTRAHLQIERLAKEQERLRIARDLHDLLGHALTTITVKAELASKLASRDPGRAAAEMAEVAALGRQGLADVRATVAGYREVNLVTELAAARQVLAAAGISAELPATTEAVPGELRELFGWVLREGVTNAVRHSGAQHVRVRVDGHSIEISDDGSGPPSAPASSRPGSGLDGLRERVAAVGGQLEAVSAVSAESAVSVAVTSGPAAAGMRPVRRGFLLRAVIPAAVEPPAAVVPTTAFPAVPSPNTAASATAGSGAGVLGSARLGRCWLEHCGLEHCGLRYWPSGRDGDSTGRRIRGPVKMIKVLLADDQHLVRGALAALISLEDDLEVVGQVGRGDEVVSAVTRLHPDVVLMDVEMPGIDGLAAARAVRATAPDTQVLVVTTFGRTGYLRRAMEAGALGFVVKDAPAEALAEAIRRVARGERVVDPTLAAATLAGGASPLTGRERDVLVAARDGATVADIARRLFLSEGTVRNYLSAVIAKTGTRNRMEALRVAEDSGWL
ncbi:two component transcriptional regulator, LuxR family [Parafrankia sp. EUN1f]|nr:two component transcriptional regulator, LuxR family [Parafrankia sp. EUN1f]